MIVSRENRGGIDWILNLDDDHIPQESETIQERKSSMSTVLLFLFVVDSEFAV